MWRVVNFEPCYSSILSSVARLHEELHVLGERHLRASLQGFVEHYHRERHHQGLGNQLIQADPKPAGAGPVKCRERLGGTLNFYYREAA